MRRLTDLFYFPGWTIHPVVLFIVFLLLLAGAATGIYWLVL